MSALLTDHGRGGHGVAADQLRHDGRVDHSQSVQTANLELLVDDGEIVTLDKQDRARWDRLLITHGLAALDRAEEIGGTGSYAIQAKIAACHARAPRAEDTDWVRIASLYGDLVALTRSPIVELNRAVAVSMADGPAAGLAVTDGLLDVAALRHYHLLPSVRGDLLAKLGRPEEARAAFERAAELTSNEAERAHLLARASSS